MRIGPPGHLTRRLAAHPMPHLRPVRRSLHATHAVATLLRLDGRSAHGSARARESARPLATHFDLRRATNPNDRVPADAASPRGDYEAPKGRAAGARQRTIATHPAPTSVKRSSYALTARFHATERRADCCLSSDSAASRCAKRCPRTASLPRSRRLPLAPGRRPEQARASPCARARSQTRRECSQSTRPLKPLI